MKCNKIKDIIQKNIQKVYTLYPILCSIIQAIEDAGGKAYFVGGMVRDMFLQIPIKDIDIEVHGLQKDALAKTLQQFGPVDTIGKSFGVVRLHGLDIDWSLPRADSSGRKPTVEINPFMPIEQALTRRDLTINAMAIQMPSQQFIDPFNGLADLEAGILRSPNIDFFSQDPLRFFRVMSFIARFDMEPDSLLDELCTTMDIKGVSPERIEQECAKMLLRSKRPSLGIRWLARIGRLQEILPELAATIGVPQNPAWHPEGDVFEHSMQALDAAAHLHYVSEEEKLTVLYAALCHDLGKAVTTISESSGIHSYGHEHAGEPIARSMMKRITRNKELINKVAKLVLLHMEPLHFIMNNAKPAAYKRLAHKLYPDVNIAMLLKVATADRRGRNGRCSLPLEIEDTGLQLFAQRAEQAQVVHEREPALLKGKDFLDIVSPGPLLGKMVAKAYELQLEGQTDPAMLKQETLNFFNLK